MPAGYAIVLVSPFKENVLIAIHINCIDFTPFGINNVMLSGAVHWILQVSVI